MIETLIKILLSYLLGSLMGGLIVGRLRGVDIRKLGSGNAGTTNALRTQGLLFSIPVFAIDVGKGLIATLWLPGSSLAQQFGPTPHFLVENLPYACGLAVVIGHIYPVFFGFRGGKGVATLLGVLACLVPMTLLFFGMTWLLTLILTGYVGMASVLGFGAATVAVAARAGFFSSPAIFMYFILLLVLYTHRANIRRLRDGSESRFEKVMLLRRIRARKSGSA